MRITRSGDPDTHREVQLTKSSIVGFFLKKKKEKKNKRKETPTHLAMRAWGSSERVIHTSTLSHTITHRNHTNHSMSGFRTESVEVIRYGPQKNTQQYKEHQRMRSAVILEIATQMLVDSISSDGTEELVVPPSWMEEANAMRQEMLRSIEDSANAEGAYSTSNKVR